jgi:hypothetical protein
MLVTAEADPRPDPEDVQLELFDPLDDGFDFGVWMASLRSDGQA